MYSDANHQLASTDGTNSTFLRSPDFDGTSYGPVATAFASLRDDLQRILGDTSTSLDMTGTALSLAATEYAKTDDAVARDEFGRLKRVNGDPPRVGVTPPVNP